MSNRRPKTGRLRHRLPHYRPVNLSSPSSRMWDDDRQVFWLVSVTFRLWEPPTLVNNSLYNRSENLVIHRIANLSLTRNLALDCFDMISNSVPFAGSSDSVQSTVSPNTSFYNAFYPPLPINYPQQLNSEVMLTEPFPELLLAPNLGYDSSSSSSVQTSSPPHQLHSTSPHQYPGSFTSDTTNYSPDRSYIPTTSSCITASSGYIPGSFQISDSFQVNRFSNK